MKNKTSKEFIFVDIVIPSVKVTEKMLKHKHLRIKVNRAWGKKPKIIPVIIGTLGFVKKRIEKHIEKKLLTTSTTKKSRR